MRYHFFIIVSLLCLAVTATAQYPFVGQLPKEKRYSPEEVIDPRFGISMYERLNAATGGDSVRNCKGYACNQWVEDYYTSGQLLHKGFYVNGQLKVYKNFYPDGKMERDFRVVDEFTNEKNIYYDSGILKTSITYNGNNPVKWEDHYSNGQTDYYEELDKVGGHYICQKSFSENGKPESLLELTNPKKLLYLKREYHPNGHLIIEGNMIFDPVLCDYRMAGKWSFFYESGNLIKEEFYSNGKLVKEKKY